MNESEEFRKADLILLQWRAADHHLLVTADSTPRPAQVRSYVTQEDGLRTPVLGTDREPPDQNSTGTRYPLRVRVCVSGTVPRTNR